MELAIDVGNTQITVGVWSGSSWLEVFRSKTDPDSTEDDLASWLMPLMSGRKLDGTIERVIFASVSPSLTPSVRRLCDKWLRAPMAELTPTSDVGLKVLYEPVSAVGSDRIANALGALQISEPPIIIVDFGTATTFDVIDKDGSYAGGAILPGPRLAAQALAGRTAKLPQIELRAPDHAIGRSTVESLQSGLVLGYAAAIDGLAGRIIQELNATPVILSTGGLAELYTNLCASIQRYEPTLTLDGLIEAGRRLLP